MEEANQHQRLENVEQVATQVFGEDMGADLKSAVEITQAILSDSPELLENNRESLVKRNMSGMERQLVANATQELELKQTRYEAFIKGGRRKLEEELQKVTTKEEKAWMKQEYKEAILLGVLVKMETIESLASNLLNPYAIHETPQAGEMIYSPEFETATSYDHKTDTWKSNWSPEVHHSKLTGRFVSPKTTKEIQEGLELYFRMRNEVLTIKGKINKEDPEQAQKILDEILGKETAQVRGNARVIFNPVSITIVLEDEEDFHRLYGSNKAGGFHHSYQDDLGFSRKGILNIIQGGVFRSQSDIANTIAHEQEHSLNEIFVQNKDGYKDLTDIVQGGFMVLKEEHRQKGELSDETIQRALEIIIEQTLHETCGRELRGFADEALAYMLNNRRSANKTLETLTTTDLYECLKPEELSYRSTVQALSRGLDLEFSGRNWEYNSSLKNDEHHKFFFEYGPELFPRITKAYKEKRKSISPMVLDKLKTFQREIVDAIAMLKRGKLTNDEIRALLAGENPTKWMKIATKVTRLKDYGSEDTWKTRGRSLLSKKEQDIRDAKKKRVKGSKSKIEALIEALENKQ
jgi:hypothetical protein